MKKQVLIWFLLFLMTVSIPLFVTNRYFMHVLVVCAIYIMIASALNLVVGYMGYISFAHNALYGIGGYASALLMIRAGLPFSLSLFLAALFSGLGGLLIGFLPLRLRLQGPYFALVTMAFGLVIVSVIHNSVELTGGPLGLTSIPAPVLFGIEFRSRQSFYYMALAAAWLTVLFVVRLTKSKMGRAFEAIRDDEQMAECVGVNTAFYKIACFTLSAVLTGIAGAMFAHYTRFLGPDMFSIGEAVDMIMMVIIGGMGTIVGPIIGAVIIVVLPEALRGLSEYRMIIYSLLLIVTIMFVPKGLVGVWELVRSAFRKSLGASEAVKQPDTEI